MRPQADQLASPARYWHTAITMLEQIYGLLTAAYIHNLSPFAIQFTDTIGIRWYGLSYLAGFLAAYFMLLRLSKKKIIPLTAQQVSDFVFYVAVGIIIGGRLGYCLFYDPSLFSRFSNSFPFWGVLEVHKGGMASHGGIAGVIAACIIFARKEGLSKITLFDLVALTACLGIFFGRMANFVNAELVGRPCPAGYALAVKFPQDLLNLEPWRYHEMAGISEALGYSPEIFKAELTLQNQHFFNKLAETTITRIQSGDKQLASLVDPLLTPRYPSQIYAGLLEGLAIFITLWILYIKFRKPGIASSGFMIMYPIMRVLSEEFRMPDAQLGFQALGLTRGQWLSLSMLIFSLTYSFIVLSKKSE